MLIGTAIEKMISFYNGSLHDINHFLKVWAFAKTIGEQEGLDQEAQMTLELAAVVHDIACPLCREKYGSADGKHQETEGEILAQKFLEDLKIPPQTAKRVCYLVGHHHTYAHVDGADYQILLEADFLVNAGESRMPEESVKSFMNEVFKTETGIRLLRSAYKLQ